MSWVGWGEGHVTLDVGERLGAFPGPSGDLGLRRPARGHAATTAMVTVPSAARRAQSLCRAPFSLRRPSGRRRGHHGRRTRGQLPAAHRNVTFFSRVSAATAATRGFTLHTYRARKPKRVSLSRCSSPLPPPPPLCLRRGVPAQEAFPLAPQTEGMCLPAD